MRAASRAPLNMALYVIVTTAAQLRVACIACALGLLSCTPGTRYFLYNNAGESVTVKIGEQAYTVLADHLEELDFSAWSKPGAGIRVIRAAIVHEYAVHLGWPARINVKGIWHQPDSPQFARGGLFAYHIRLQLDRAGAIQIIPTNATPPVPPGTLQPDGYPISPSATTNAAVYSSSGRLAGDAGQRRSTLR